MKIHAFSITRAQYGFTADVEIIVKTKRQFTEEHHLFNTEGKNLLHVFWNVYFDSKKEARKLQSLSGEYGLN